MSTVIDTLPITETTSPGDAIELAEVVRGCHDRGTAIYPIGGGTSLDYGLPAKRSGIGIATLRRFESTGRIGFSGLAKLLATLGLADRFLGALKQPAPAPKDINEFLAAAPAPVRQRAPRRTKAS